MPTTKMTSISGIAIHGRCSLIGPSDVLHWWVGKTKTLPACGGTETHDSVLEASLNLPHADLRLPIVGQHVPIPASCMAIQHLAKTYQSIQIGWVTLLLICQHALSQSMQLFVPVHALGQPCAI